MFELVPQSIVGLDIGSSTVKAVKLKKLKEGFELTGAEMISISSESIEELDQDARQAIIVTALKKLMKSKNVAGRTVAASIPGDAAIVRYIKMPFMSEDELKNMIPYDTRKAMDPSGIRI